MSGAIDAVADIGLSEILDFAPDIGSLVTDLGTEFLDVSSFTSFEIPGFDVSSLGGFDIAGSFAGSADWFDTFNPGSILSSIPSVSDFNLPSLPGLPSLSSLNVNNLVSSAASSFGISPSLTSQITKTLGNPSLISAGAAALGINPSIALSASKVLSGGSPVSAAASALGISPSIVSSATNILNGGSPVAAGAAALGINPSVATSLTAKATSLFTTDPNASNARDVATGLPINTPREVDQFGLSILTDAESTALTKKATLVNSLIDPGTGSTTTSYDQAVATIAEFTAAKADTENAIAVNERVIANANKNIEEMQANLQDPDLSDAQRASLQRQIDANQATIAEASNALLSNTQNLNEINAQLEEDARVIASTDATATNSPAAVATGVVPGVATPGPVPPLTEAANVAISSTATTANADALLAEAIAANQATNTDTSPTETDVLAFTNQARNQQTIRDLRQNKAAASDWRVRLRLAPNSDYLYNADQPGILAPLASKTGTDGVIFPYTPNIETAYKANYDPYDLTHSNYRGYFYKNSYVDVLNLRATFTAQDTEEANYLLAVIHFFRSATKMFYGKDAQRGSPPPLVYLSGYGDFQFNEHPCVIQQFNYTLPSDVDYIRAGSAVDASTNMLGNRTRQSTPGNPLSYAINRLLNNNLTKGALDNRPPLVSNFNVGNPTYVPTKIEISVSLFPMQSRQQVSKQFSLQAFANGNQLKGGFW